MFLSNIYNDRLKNNFVKELLSYYNNNPVCYINRNVLCDKLSKLMSIWLHMCIIYNTIVLHPLLLQCYCILIIYNGIVFHSILFHYFWKQFLSINKSNNFFLFYLCLLSTKFWSKQCNSRACHSAQYNYIVNCFSII